MNRGLSVVDTYQILIGKELDDETHFKASILGWAVELVRPSQVPRLDSRLTASSYKPFFWLRTI